MHTFWAGMGNLPSNNMKSNKPGGTLPMVAVAKVTKHFDEKKGVGKKVLFINKDYLGWLHHHLISFKDDGKFQAMIEWKSDSVEVEIVSDDIRELFSDENGGGGKCICEWNILLAKGCQCGGS